MSDALWADVKRTRVWENVDAQIFRDKIQPLNQPAILKGLAAEFPLVEEARKSTQALCDYLKSFSSEKPLEFYFGAQEMAGRFSYSADFKGFNFEKRTTTLSGLLDLLLQHLNGAHAPHIYAGAVNVPTHAPKLVTANHLTLIDPSIEQLVSLWIGNKSRTAAHWDLPQNIACVIAGRRRYTMFPTEQVKNLYIGPLDFTLAGRPISLVDFRAPDFETYPRFRDAMAAAEIADLEPGDAVYVPSLWFHHVESMDAFGVMMNFWWREAAAHLISPSLTMFHALLTLRDLPAQERAAWRTMFDYFVFETDGDAFAHLPDEARGVFGAMTPERLAQLKDYLRRTIK
ncbi:MAG: cupin-like domain-containing protein [Pseudomonadota bacterium]